MSRPAPSRRAKHKTVRRAKWHQSTDRWQACDADGNCASFARKPVFGDGAWWDAGCWELGPKRKRMTIAQAAASLRRIVP